MARDTTASAADDSHVDIAEPLSLKTGELDSPAVRRYKAMFESLPPEAKAHFARELEEWRSPGWRERYDKELEEARRRSSGDT